MALQKARHDLAMLLHDLNTRHDSDVDLLQVLQPYVPKKTSFSLKVVLTCMSVVPCRQFIWRDCETLLRSLPLSSSKNR